MIKIEIQKRSMAKEFVVRMCSKAEDLFFEILLLLPEQYIPIGAVESYLERRTRQLEQQRIKAEWRRVHLSKTVENMKSR